MEEWTMKMNVQMAKLPSMVREKTWPKFIADSNPILGFLCETEKKYFWYMAEFSNLGNFKTLDFVKAGKLRSMVWSLGGGGVDYRKNKIPVVTIE